MERRVKAEAKCTIGGLRQMAERQILSKVLFSCYTELWRQLLPSNPVWQLCKLHFKPGISHVQLAFKLHEAPLDWVNAYTKHFSLEW